MSERIELNNADDIEDALEDMLHDKSVMYVGKRRNAFDCPIARAVERNGGIGPRVVDPTISFNGPDGDLRMIWASDRLACFMQKIDNGEKPDVLRTVALRFWNQVKKGVSA